MFLNTLYKWLNSRPKRFSQAFTLLELSVALVIIACIMSGVIAASYISKQAALRSIIGESTAYRNAFNSFFAQYNAIPGDMINATAYWYDATACPGTTGTSGSCNGNNNMRIDMSTSLTSNEETRAWQHLMFSGVISGYFSGTASSAGASDVQHTIGTNCPASKFPGGGYAFRSGTYMQPNSQTYLTLGATMTNDIPWAVLLTPPDAYSIDSKIDDGLATLGSFSGYHGSGGTCYSGTAYSVSTTTAQCYLVFDISNH
jgi:prepilin-type N-terminal cleavage/methylation domain-containing protein